MRLKRAFCSLLSDPLKIIERRLHRIGCIDHRPQTLLHSLQPPGGVMGVSPGQAACMSETALAVAFSRCFKTTFLGIGRLHCVLDPLDRQICKSRLSARLGSSCHSPRMV